MAAEPAAMASAARKAVVVMTMVMVGAVEARVVAMGAKEEVEEATVAEAWRVRGLTTPTPLAAHNTHRGIAGGYGKLATKHATAFEGLRVRRGEGSTPGPPPLKGSSALRVWGYNRTPS